MKIALVLFLFTAQFAVAEPRDSRALFALWGKISAPLPAPEPDPIGTYGAGCLAGAKALPLDGKGYAVMRPSRRRYFGHPALVEFVEGLAKKMQKMRLPLLLVGDLSRPRGGPMISGHASHQVGLDADLWYRMEKKRPSAADREKMNSPSLVVHNRQVKKAWTKNHRAVLALAAAAPEVERIFVNPAIKKNLCETFPDAPWLYKVRGWWGHDDHFHVRLHCPEGSTHCVPQPPLDPKETQCGSDLAWFFSKEAEEEGKAKLKIITERGFPELPAACARMPDGNL